MQEADETIGGDGVELVTFHGAKGREWRAVHVVGAEDGFVPIAWATTDAEKAEERRLFYVAVTRATDQLSITWSASRRARRRPQQHQSSVAVPARASAPSSPSSATAAARGGAASPAPATGGRPRRRCCPRRCAPAVALRAGEGLGIADDAVLPEHVLREVARTCPSDADDLARIPGTGPLLLAGLADEVLDSLRG